MHEQKYNVEKLIQLLGKITLQNVYKNGKMKKISFCSVELEASYFVEFSWSLNVLCRGLRRHVVFDQKCFSLS